VGTSTPHKKKKKSEHNVALMHVRSVVESAAGRQRQIMASQCSTEEKRGYDQAHFFGLRNMGLFFLVFLSRCSYSEVTFHG
jgi:hypothetical protein